MSIRERVFSTDEFIHLDEMIDVVREYIYIRTGQRVVIDITPSIMMYYAMQITQLHQAYEYACFWLKENHFK